MPLDFGIGDQTRVSDFQFEGLRVHKLHGEEQIGAMFVAREDAINPIVKSMFLEEAEVKRIAQKPARDETGLRIVSEGVYVEDAKKAYDAFQSFEAGEISLDDVPHVAEAEPLATYDHGAS